MTTCTDEEMETLSLSSTTPGPSSGPGSSAALPPPASAAVAESPTPVTKRPTYDSDSDDDGAIIGGYGDHVGSGEDMWIRSPLSRRGSDLRFRKELAIASAPRLTEEQAQALPELLGLLCDPKGLSDIADAHKRVSFSEIESYDARPELSRFTMANELTRLTYYVLTEDGLELNEACAVRRHYDQHELPSAASCCGTCELLWRMANHSRSSPSCLRRCSSAGSTRDWAPL